jgi:hypothetical protein
LSGKERSFWIRCRRETSRECQSIRLHSYTSIIITRTNRWNISAAGCICRDFPIALFFLVKPSYRLTPCIRRLVDVAIDIVICHRVQMFKGIIVRSRRGRRSKDLIADNVDFCTTTTTRAYYTVSRMIRMTSGKTTVPFWNFRAFKSRVKYTNKTGLPSMW